MNNHYNNYQHYVATAPLDIFNQVYQNKNSVKPRWSSSTQRIPLEIMVALVRWINKRLNFFSMKKKDANQKPKIVRLDKPTPIRVDSQKRKKPVTYSYGSGYDPKEIGIDNGRCSYGFGDGKHDSYDGGNPHDC